MFNIHIFIEGVVLLLIHHKLSGNIDVDWFWVLSPAIFIVIYILLEARRDADEFIKFMRND